MDLARPAARHLRGPGRGGARLTHVVLGASGAVGGAVVAELARRGEPVRAVARRPVAGVDSVTADLLDPAAAARALAGAQVAYHCAQPPEARWLEAYPALTKAILDGAAAAGAKLVVVEDLAHYGPQDRPLVEDLKQRPEGPRGRVRRETAAALLADGRTRVTLGRASDAYGPGGRRGPLGDTVFAAALAGRPVEWLGSLDAYHTMSYLPDLARDLVTLGTRPEADGRAWHLPAAEPLTGRQFLALVTAAVGRPVRVRRVGRLHLRVAGALRVGPNEEREETLHQWDRSHIVDASAFDLAFRPPAATPHAEAVSATAAWFRAQAG